MNIFILRFIIVALLTVTGYFFPPFFLSSYLGAGLAFILSLGVVYLEMRLRRSQFKVIWGGTVGVFIGVFFGYLLGIIYQTLFQKEATAEFIRVFFLLVMPYLGYLIGSRRSEWFNPAYLLSLFKEKGARQSYKVLDTSVIIDGRIADICNAAFVEGVLVIPKFVLQELQKVADSSDSIKRQRGRRGLDVLDHLQKSAQVSVIISDVDYPEIKEVDTKLIELAKHLEAKIVTNDFNLNKVAQFQGIPVLNINELANALKPMVLPGESIKVHILKEGKEKDQGVAYLDDGTMVVVDNSRKKIGQSVDITVTSVLQTTVGKMIFGRYNEES